jgi:hypothetical protein
VNAPLHRELILGQPGATSDLQAALPLETEGVQRYVWRGRFAEVLIEVDGDVLKVNGAVVVPAGGEKSGLIQRLPL